MTDTDGAGNTPGGMGPRPDAGLLRLLVCPVSRGPLAYHEEAQELVSEKARLAFPVRKGIPVMLESEARSIDRSVLTPG